MESLNIKNFRLKRDWVRIFITLVLFSSGYLWNSIASGIAMYRSPEGRGWVNHETYRAAIENRFASRGKFSPPGNSTAFDAVLPDIGFDVLPFLEHEIATKILIGYMIVTLIRSMIGKNCLDTLITILTRFMLVDTMLFTIRGITINATSMNNPYPGCYNCHGVWNGYCPETIWQALYLILKSFPFVWSVDCGDLMFSGHTVHYLLCTLIWYDYFLKNILIKIILWIATCACVTLIIATRLHYTNDVLIAILLTVFLWYLYHYILDHHMKNAKLSIEKNDISIWRESYNQSSYFARIILWIENISVESFKEFYTPQSVQTVQPLIQYYVPYPSYGTINQ